MDTHKWLLRFSGVVCVILILASCGTPQTEATLTLAPTATEEPTTAPTMMPTQLPSTNTSTPEDTPEEIVWDYVALGDSTVAMPGDFSYANHFAAYIEEDMGVKVIVHNKGVTGMQSGELLEKIRTDESWRDLIREAEIVTLVIGSNDLSYLLIDEYKYEKCGGEDNWDCLRTALASIKTNYAAIYEEIQALGGPAIPIRSMTEPYGTGLTSFGFDGELKPFFEPMNVLIMEVAAEYHVPVAQVHLAFNGPTGEESADEKGYFLDGLHPSKEGAIVIAELHRALGYETGSP